MTQQFFTRNEKKYLLSAAEYRFIQQQIEQHLVRDRFFESSIHTVYFDTEDNELIIESLEAKDYKYKIRLRRYGEGVAGQRLFFEIKSKLNGIVYKRRAVVSPEQYETYCRDGIRPDNQVLRELEHVFRHKALRPKIAIRYERQAYRARDKHSDLRITFDTNLRSRTDAETSEMTDGYENYFDKPAYIMEIKTSGGMPLWLSGLLSARKIFPTSFSKYGRIYQKMKRKEAVYA